MWVINNRGEKDTKLALSKFLAELWKYLTLHNTRVLVVGYGFTFAACAMVVGDDDANLRDPLDAYLASSAYNTSAYYNTSAQGRMLRGGGGAAASSASASEAHGYAVQPVNDASRKYFIGDHNESISMLWILLACASVINIYYFNYKLFLPFDEINVFMLSVNTILQRDIAKFLFIFLFYLVNFYFALYVLYPRSGDVYLPQVMTFNTWYGAALSLVELGFTGANPELNLEPENWAPLSHTQSLALMLWFVLYILYILIALVLLLNLLIAMLSFTFDFVREESTLQCRVAFAQGMQRLEQLATILRMEMKVGHVKGSIRTYDFRSIGDSVETPQGQGSNDPFAPAPEEDVSAGARLESKVDAMHKQLEALTKMVESRQAQIVETSTVRSADAKVAPARRMREMIARANAQKKHLQEQQPTLLHSTRSSHSSRFFQYRKKADDAAEHAGGHGGTPRDHGK